MHLFEGEIKEDVPKKMGVVADELKFLVKGIMRSPKSYTLWFQRQWIIQKGLVFERDLKMEDS